MMRLLYDLFIHPFAAMGVLVFKTFKVMTAFLAVFFVLYAILGVCIYATGMLQLDWMAVLNGQQGEQSLWVVQFRGQVLYLDTLCVFWPIPSFFALIGVARAFARDPVEYTNLRSRPLANKKKGQA